MTTFPKLAYDGLIPPKLWMRALDIAARYRVAGEAWVLAGRPRHGSAWVAFKAADDEYEAMHSQVYYARKTPEQRAEWEAMYA